MLTARAISAKIQPSTAFDGGIAPTDQPSLPPLYRESSPLPPINPGLTVRDFRVDDVNRWRVAHTKSRAEKQFAWDMLRAGLPYFLPLVEYRDRHRNYVVRPAFPSYVFICGNDEVVYAARATKRVCQIIEVIDQAKLVRELERLQIVAGDNGLIAGTDNFTIGQRCVVKQGHSLEGTEGWIESKGDRGFVSLRVTILGDSVPVEIGREFLDPIEQ